MIICRYGEIFLKGQNRGFFERALMQNIMVRMAGLGIQGEVHARRNRILADADDCSFLRTVFGVTSFSPALQAVYTDTLAEIVASAVKLLSPRPFDSFMVRAKHLTPLNISSLDINRRVGAALAAHFSARVDLENPSIVLGIEIMGTEAFLFTETHPGPGGLPVGVSGAVRILDGPFARLSALMMSKRGCSIDTNAEILVSGSLEPAHLNTELPVFYPLAGMTQQQALEKQEHYETLFGKNGS